MSEKFKIGDVVTLTCINAAMTVVEVDAVTFPNMPTRYYCAWMDRDMHAIREWFPEAALKAYAK